MDLSLQDFLTLFFHHDYDDDGDDDGDDCDHAGIHDLLILH